MKQCAGMAARIAAAVKGSGDSTGTGGGARDARAALTADMTDVEKSREQGVYGVVWYVLLLDCS